MNIGEEGNYLRQNGGRKPGNCALISAGMCDSFYRSHPRKKDIKGYRDNEIGPR
jgi:hypothetical protein